jgi:hypothetical protein
VPGRAASSFSCFSIAARRGLRIRRRIASA